MYRVGIGFDVHPLEANKKGLYLGGIKVSEEYSSIGHSDGDALIHAIVDAILGATNAGNIGNWFPENEENRGRRSTEFLEIIRKKVLTGTYEILNIDSVIITDKVRLNPHIENIRLKLAEILDINKGNINVKPKSGNTLYGNSVSVYAVCMLKKVGT